ncbi:MAG: D-isomer specific 2-hydroxyacid dehydrogenase NAD-binding protein [Bacteroidetes bacterium]|nr:D-isomer specific 2-hydroxyacid dehydrogenase NAD-binding protein [Bacteroidota bacterium]
MSKKILANDGIDAQGKALLEKAGFTVITEKVAQENLAAAINEQNYVGLTVRSATKVRKDVIDACPGLKLIGRGGVGMDNIDVDYAKSKGLAVVNTPAASSHSVAELVFAHLFNAVRFLYDSNRQMPANGDTQFDALKKKYAKGIELKGKTIGIVGFGRIGQNVAKIALGCGMKVLAYDPYIVEALLELDIEGAPEKIRIRQATVPLEKLLAESDFITLHVPGGKVITKNEMAKMKDGVILANAARGGVIDEADLIETLNSGKVAHACLDVFENEPTPNKALLSHPKISLTPHIGAATEEAQERIGIELAELIIDRLR